MSDETAVREAFRQQARWCRELGSPFTALLMDQAAAGLDRSTAVGARLLDWRGQPGSLFGALPLRLAGALHGLVRLGRVPELAAIYPPNALPEGARLWHAVSRSFEQAGAELMGWLDGPPQTNEVARSAALMAGLTVVTSRFGLPVSLFELGASAGLNLLLDRYAYRLGSVEAGVPGAAVRLTPEWRGTDPPAAAVRVVGRRGVDLQPLDASDPRDRERLVAYVWVDQAARIARLQAALQLAQADPPVVDRGDAADWVEQRLATSPERGIARVMLHSIAHQYFPPEVQARIAAHAARVGAAATAEGPFAWLRLEVDQAKGGPPLLTLTTWPDGTTCTLARGSAHGLWIEWLA